MLTKDFIRTRIPKCLRETDFPSLGNKYRGKVRDTYLSGDRLTLITTDRQSAFDRLLAHVPFKGQVLNQTAAWWFQETRHIVPNHVLEIPDPNVIIGKRLRIFPVEIVVRAYLTGITSTSIWTGYQKGERSFGGIKLPDGMKKNEKLEKPILTPTTKSDDHDAAITSEVLVKQNLMTQKEWDEVAEKALALFAFGQKRAAEHGLILVDTKYEFGVDANGTITIADEMHTPDSSRWWLRESYEARLARGEEPEMIDKEFFRIWFRDHCDPYGDKTLPEAPEELVVELSSRYIQLFERITGNTFETAGDEVTERIRKNLKIK